MPPIPRLARPPPGLSRLVRLVVVLLIAGTFWPRLALATPSINVLVSNPGGIYQETAASLTQALRRAGWKATVTGPDQYSAEAGDLTVAIGTRALEMALTQPARPILSVLVPRLTYERLASGRNQVSALYLDQPLSRQLQLLALAVPGLRKVGVPLGPTSRGQQTSLQHAAKDSGIQVNTALVDQGSDLHVALTRLAQDSQAFVLLPDPVVAQRSMLQNFLLHTYRLRKPVLAYSAPLAQSGALLSLYATPAQLGEEAAEWIAASQAKGAFQLGSPRYPRRFTIGINRTVARSLEIDLPSEADLAIQLEARL